MPADKLENFSIFFLKGNGDIKDRSIQRWHLASDLFASGVYASGYFDSIKIDGPTTPGYILTADSEGWGTWQPGTDILVTAVPLGDQSTSGMKMELTAHDNVVFGDVCFINASGEAQLIDASSIDTMSGTAMATDTISANNNGIFLLSGIARNSSWSWTVGGLIYGTTVGTNTNTISQIAPSGTNEVIQLLGVATHINRMYFNPSLPQVEHI